MADPTAVESIRVEVAYAEPSRQFLRRIELAAGATVADAIAASNIEREYGIDASQLSSGIWSKAAERSAILREGDRVELYRPLTADPKDSRRRRAERAARARSR
jgi:putative ubiquitin-RnfH superfamily antitoxin RatB of RatAB toxin-antitoxin module